MLTTTNRTNATQPRTNVALSVPDTAPILILCENDADSAQLKTVFGEAGLTSQRVKSFTSGCELVRRGRFQVVFSAPLLRDGSWKCLIEAASQYDLGFEIVLVARTFDLKQWAEALQIGAFDVLDVVCDLPKAAEAAERAWGAAYLKRFRSRPPIGQFLKNTADLPDSSLTASPFSV